MEGTLAQCPKLQRCPFFNNQMANMPSLAEIMKTRYCVNDHESCARFMLASAGQAVPGDLFPNDGSRAKSLLGQG